MRILSPSLYVAAVLALPAPAFAVQLAQAAGTAEEIEQRARKEITERTPGIEQPVQLSAELGTALTRGNTETFHIASTVRLTWAFAVPLLLWLSAQLEQLLHAPVTARTGVPA